MLRDKILKLNSQLCYKVAFIGSKEVGKTTLASYLNGQLKSLGLSVDIVPEVARYCPLPLNEKTTIESAYWLLGAQISAEALVEKTRQFVICDRTVLDVFPFIKCSHEHKEDAFSPTTLLSLKTLIRSYLVSRPYDIFYYVPIVGTDCENAIQSSDKALQLAIDKEFRIFLEELSEEIDINVHFIEQCSAQERVAEIIQHLYSQINDITSLTSNDFTSLEELKVWLTTAEIDLSKWGIGDSKVLENLWNELLDNEIVLEANPYMRKVEVAQIIVKQGKYYLLEVAQEFGDGHIRSRKQPPTEKMYANEDYQTAALRCLKEELKLKENQVKFFPATYHKAKEVTESSSYPGLATQYIIHSIEAEVTGLPEKEFWCDNLAYGIKDSVKRHHWAWVSKKPSIIAGMQKDTD